MNFSQPEIWILGILLTIVAWIGNKMVSKQDDLGKGMSNISEKLAVILEKLSKHEEKFDYQERQIHQNEKMIMELREKNHDVRNLINEQNLRIMELDERCKNRSHSLN
jgi:chromosome segregation ATPase